MHTGSAKNTSGVSELAKTEVTKYLSLCFGEDYIPDIYTKAFITKLICYHYPVIESPETLREWIRRRAEPNDLAQEFMMEAISISPNEPESRFKYQFCSRASTSLCRFLRGIKYHLQQIAEPEVLSDSKDLLESYLPRALKATNFLKYNINFYRANGFQINELAKKYQLDRKTIRAI